MVLSERSSKVVQYRLVLQCNVRLKFLPSLSVYILSLFFVLETCGLSQHVFAQNDQFDCLTARLGQAQVAEADKHKNTLVNIALSLLGKKQ